MALQGDEICIAASSIQCLDEEEDWEALADRVASSEEVLSSVNNHKTAASDLSTKDEPIFSPRRRGRGSFMYRKNELYCDLPDNATISDHSSFSKDEDDESSLNSREESETLITPRHGTDHVIVLYDIPPTTSTTQLEILFEKFTERGFAIRWVNDTVALAVFPTPSTAKEFLSSIHFPFKARPLEEKDTILTQIFPSDLEPPMVRPKTSARTAQRLIAHAMGIGLSNCILGSGEFRKQEKARKDRIHERRNMKDDAWGSD